jgi:hypothetical protein
MNLLQCVFVLFSCLFSNCNDYAKQETIIGIYQNEGRRPVLRVTLNEDSTFLFEEFLVDSRYFCIGTWGFNSSDSLIILKNNFKKNSYLNPAISCSSNQEKSNQLSQSIQKISFNYFFASHQRSIPIIDKEVKVFAQNQIHLSQTDSMGTIDFFSKIKPDSLIIYNAFEEEILIKNDQECLMDSTNKELRINIDAELGLSLVREYQSYRPAPKYWRKINFGLVALNTNDTLRKKNY